MVVPLIVVVFVMVRVLSVVLAVLPGCPVFDGGAPGPLSNSFPGLPP